MNFKCYLCSLVFPTSKYYIRHLKMIHGIYDENKPELRCGVLLCEKTYTTFSGLRKHMELHNVDIINPQFIANVDPEGDVIEEVAVDEEACEVNNITETPAPLDTLPGMYVVGSCNVTQNDVSGILNPEVLMVEQTEDFQNISERLVDKFLSDVRKLNIPDVKIDMILKSVATLTSQSAYSIRNLLDENSQLIIAEELNFLEMPFKDISTKYKRNKRLFEKNTPVAKEIALHVRRDRRWCRATHSFVFRPKTDSFMFTSIIETLKFLCKNYDFLCHIFNVPDENENEICSPRDGKRFKNSELYSVEPFSFLIQIYLDEFETTNPLGSKTIVHKIYGIYFTILNLPPEINSKLENIFILGLCIAIDLKKEEIFKKVLNHIKIDLDILETDGIIVEFKDNQHILKGTIFSFSHDNLAANFICGLNESFNARYYCRICLTPSDECRTLTNDLTVIYRNYNDNQIHLATKIYGTKTDCPLNELKYFNTFDSPSIDVMHDILEGIGPYELKKFLIFVVKELKIISMDEVNLRISNFNYGILNIKNKPSTINIDSKSNAIGQKASQFWCLMRFFPIIFKDFIELNIDKVRVKWDIILLLVKISQYCFAYRLPKNAPNILRSLIDEHHTLLIHNYAPDVMLPKHHIMIHYPMIIEQMGPLIYQWTMRYEAKHAFFKLAAANAHNFINICKTLSRKHELYYADKYCENNFKSDISYTCDVQIRLRDLMPEDFQIFLKNRLVLSDETVLSYIKNLKFGYEYNANFYICSASNFIALPTFEKICMIFELFNNIFFITKFYKTLNYNAMAGGYEIEEAIELNLINLKDLKFPKPYESHSPLNSMKNYIIPKFIL